MKPPSPREQRNETGFKFLKKRAQPVFLAAIMKTREDIETFRFSLRVVGRESAEHPFRAPFIVVRVVFGG